MTKDEAIELLEDLDGAIEDNHGRDYDEALRMAIESLSVDSVRIEVYRDLYVKYIELKHKVVRCEVCKYRQDDITHNFCEINHHKCYDDDFCSWGKRWSNDENCPRFNKIIPQTRAEILTNK